MQVGPVKYRFSRRYVWFEVCATIGDIGDDVGLIPFPQPAMNVGGSPRWSSDDVDAWLMVNKDKKTVVASAKDLINLVVLRCSCQLSVVDISFAI